MHKILLYKMMTAKIQRVRHFLSKLLLGMLYHFSPPQFLKSLINKDDLLYPQVLEPILSKLDSSCFDVLDRKLVWSSKRPVWFQVYLDKCADTKISNFAVENFL